MTISKKTIHFIVLYILLFVVLALTVIALTKNTDPQEWVCVQEVCLESEPAGEAWAQENCEDIIVDNGTQVRACIILIDGVEQYVPLSSLNLSAIQACTLYQCLQEVPVRAVEYTYTR